MNKSFFLTNPKASAYKINRMRQCTGFLEKNFPFTYQGCPINIGRKKISYFDDMVTKVVKRLNGWQGKMLTYGGKNVLIKSVLQSLPICTLSAINPPIGTINENREKYHWRSWKNICVPKDKGGIGIRNMDDISRTSAVKRQWRLEPINLSGLIL